eukprot:scaffold1356_cov123-Cylindrotheca_fusiformis.AAC.46
MTKLSTINEQLNSNCTEYRLDDKELESLAKERILEWGANFTFSAVCVGSFIVLLYSPKRGSKVLPFYFLAMACSYVILGLEQVLDGRLSEMQETRLQKASYCFGGAGSIIAFVFGLQILHIKPKSDSMVKNVFWWFLVCPLSIMMMTAILVDATVTSGVPLHAFASFGLLAFLVCVYMFQICKERGAAIWHCLAKTLSVFMITLQFFYTALLVLVNSNSRENGDMYNFDCHDDSNSPVVRRHGLIHDVSLILGYAVWAWSEDAAPSISYGYPAYMLDITESGNTVQSYDDSISSSSSSDVGDCQDEDVEVAVNGDTAKEAVRLNGDDTNLLSSHVEGFDSFQTARSEGSMNRNDVGAFSA